MQTTKPETAQQRPTGARMALLMLLYFIKIGAFTFGSGWSILAQMEQEFVDKRRWLTKQELLELEEMGTAAAILGKSLYTGALDLRRCVALVQK